MTQEKNKQDQEVETNDVHHEQHDQACREAKLNELTLLKQSIDEQKQKAEEYHSHLLRLQAEFDNYRKRMEREKQELITYGQEVTILKLLPLVDNIERALKAALEHDDHKTIIEGLGLIEKEFKQFFRTEGIEQIPAQHMKLDPRIHHVISQEEREDVEDEEVVEEIQKGYSFKGKVVRPALVKVAKKIEKNEGMKGE